MSNENGDRPNTVSVRSGDSWIPGEQQRLAAILRGEMGDTKIGSQMNENLANEWKAKGGLLYKPFVSEKEDQQWSQKVDHVAAYAGDILYLAQHKTPEFYKFLLFTMQDIARANPSMTVDVDQLASMLVGATAALEENGLIGRVQKRGTVRLGDIHFHRFVNKTFFPPQESWKRGDYKDPREIFADNGRFLDTLSRASEALGVGINDVQMGAAAALHVAKYITG